jgi:asparagine synthase (glutamine-hydrolysing)
MSILWGLMKDHSPVRQQELDRLAEATSRYGTDDPAMFIKGNVGMGLQPVRSHARSLQETRPFVDPLGNVICFDGRLDNYRELAEMYLNGSAHLSDSEIVLAAFKHWGERCFAYLTGDWALALWWYRERTLFLARDHAGSRSLYFANTANQIQWATYLDTFTTSGAKLHLSEDYAAAYLSCERVGDLTPYREIRAVSPGHYVTIRRGESSQRAHWSPLIRKSIRYRDEKQYDDHFLSLFGKAIARRTGPGEPVLAQLSGGMDSTSIVCMSDRVRRRADPNAELLDTLSFFDDSETSLDERRYFSITEAYRGKTGIRLEVPFAERGFDPPFSNGSSYQFPGRDEFSIKFEQQLLQTVSGNGYRSILSGIGGDEILGGIPTGLPELADYLVTGRFTQFFKRALAWSLPQRSPLIETLSATVHYTARLYTRKNPKRRPVPPWLRKAPLHTFESVDLCPNRLGAAPHQLENAFTWWQIMETLPHLSPPILFRPEYRYPMLDKDLVEYLFAIPPEQLVQPGRRRAMMRRALRGIVPREILERRRKAFQIRGPMKAIRSTQPKLERLISRSLLSEMGLIDIDKFRSELRGAADGNGQWYQAILRTIGYELWLQARSPQGEASRASTEIRNSTSTLAAL